MRHAKISPYTLPRIAALPETFIPAHWRFAGELSAPQRQALHSAIARDLKRQGYHMRDIANFFGVSKGRIYQLLARSARYRKQPIVQKAAKQLHATLAWIEHAARSKKP